VYLGSEAEGAELLRPLRDLGPDMIRKVSRMLHDSIAYGLAHRRDALDHALQYGRGLDRTKAEQIAWSVEGVRGVENDIIVQP